MNSWIDFFDHIYLINLEKRTDRLLQAKWELDKYNIPYGVWMATHNENGELGVLHSYRSISAHAYDNGYENILIFEDDVLFLTDPAPIMGWALGRLPSSYDMLFMGVNLTNTGDISFRSSSLLKIQRGLSLHACAYSSAMIKKMLNRLSSVDTPVDVAIADKIQIDGNCYATYPMICTQRPGYSDIHKTQQNWSYALQHRFHERTKRLRYEREIGEEDTP